jgi:hypothetical protein
VTLSYNDLSRERTLVCLFGASKNEVESTFTSLTSNYQQICNIFFQSFNFCNVSLIHHWYCNVLLGIVVFSFCTQNDKNNSGKKFRKMQTKNPGKIKFS